MSELQGPQDEPERTGKVRPLWQWVLLGVAPGSLCHLIAFLSSVARRTHHEALAEPALALLLLAPIVGLIYLIVVGRAYKRAGMSDSSLYFIFGYGAVNLFLWGSGCCMYVNINLH
jgi:hypothetical protein